MHIISKIRRWERRSIHNLGLIALTDGSNEWNMQGWLADARNLIVWSNSIETQAPLMLLVRHSHRVAIRTLSEMSDTGITTLGKAMAFEFGLRLPARESVKILHSPIPRCKQTANEIARGITQEGGNVQSVKSNDLLLGPVVTDMQIWNEVGEDGVRVASFVTSWERGVFGKGIEPFEEFSKRLTRGTLNKLKSMDPGSLHIYVTHDLFLMGARRTLHSEEAHINQRPPYLGGYGLSINRSQVAFYEARTGKTFKLK
ncbi:MAG: histidine phosphatase family protein [Candidatus Thorarchaeota archaeon]|jgi:broad specificity phosphatase PhoE